MATMMSSSDIRSERGPSSGTSVGSQGSLSSIDRTDLGKCAADIYVRVFVVKTDSSASILGGYETSSARGNLLPPLHGAARSVLASFTPV